MTANRALIAFLASCWLAAPAGAVTVAAEAPALEPLPPALFLLYPMAANDPKPEQTRLRNEALAWLNQRGMTRYITELTAAQTAGATDERARTLEEWQERLKKTESRLETLREGRGGDDWVNDVAMDQTTNADGSRKITTTVTFVNGRTESYSYTVPAHR